jgi:hypothetical protein
MPLFSPVSAGTPIDSLAVRVTDSTYNYFSTGMGTDSSGNIYTLGYNDFSSENDGLLTKYNSAGVVEWKRKLNSNSTYTIVYGNDLVVDSSGNSYVFGGVRINSSTSYGLVVKIDNTGATVWAKQLPYTIDSRGCYGGTVDSSGNVYAVLRATSTNIAVYKFDSSGTQQLARQVNYAPGLTIYDVAVDSTGNIYLAGTHNGNYCALIKLNSSGVLQWAKHYYMSGSTSGGYYGVAVDSSDNIYAVGEAWANANNRVGVVVKYNSSGVIQWKRQSGGTTINYTYGSMRRVDVDTSGNVYVIGMYSLEGINNAFYIGLSKYNSSGTLQWSRSVTTSRYCQANWSFGITADALQNVYFSFSPYYEGTGTATGSGWHVKIPTATPKIGSVIVSNDALTVGYFTGLYDTAAGGTVPSDVTMTTSAGSASAATTTFLNQTGTHSPVAATF